MISFAFRMLCRFLTMPAARPILLSASLCYIIILLYMQLQVSVVSDCVCRWVKWKMQVVCYLHSSTSTGLVIRHWMVKVTCWSLTTAIIAFCCSTANCDCNASWLTTQTLKSSCGGQGDCLTMNSRHNYTFCTTAAVRSGCRLASSRCSMFAEWVAHRCYWPTRCYNLRLLRACVHASLSLLTI